jgi:hypothetical protein
MMSQQYGRLSHGPRQSGSRLKRDIQYTLYRYLLVPKVKVPDITKLTAIKLQPQTPEASGLLT